jgi:hypothetical protein
MNIKEIKKNIKGVFKLPIREYYLGKIYHGTPYMSPWNFCGSIIKYKEQFDRCKSFKLFGKEYTYGWPIKVIKYDLGWKDKWSTPRFEWSPSFQIWFFKWQFCMWWNAPKIEDDHFCQDHYWEQILWYLNYSQKDIVKAQTTWGWTTGDPPISTWRKEYQINPN